MNTKFNMEVNQLLIDLSFLVDPETHAKLVQIVGPEMDKQESLQTILDSIRTTTDDVRLQLKMLDFDRWATADENNKLRGMLEENNVEIKRLNDTLRGYGHFDSPEGSEEPPDSYPS